MTPGAFTAFCILGATLLSIVLKPDATQAFLFLASGALFALAIRELVAYATRKA